VELLPIFEGWQNRKSGPVDSQERRGGRAFLTQRTIFAINNASRTEDTVATIPGSMKLWFKTYLPIRVVPLWSKEMAASNVAYVGKKK
jgi:hypothetical protein